MSDYKRGSPLSSRPFPSLGAILGNRFVAFDGSVAAEDSAPLGVNRDDISAAGELGDATVIGTAFVLMAENIAAGHPVAVSADAGKGKEADATAENVVGYALNAANVGEYAEVILARVGGAFAA